LQATSEIITFCLGNRNSQRIRSSWGKECNRQRELKKQTCLLKHILPKFWILVTSVLLASLHWSHFLYPESSRGPMDYNLQMTVISFTKVFRFALLW